MQLAPVRAARVALIDLLHGAEVALVRHALVHVHGNVGRVTPISGAEPDVVTTHEAALNREMDVEALVAQAVLNLAEHGWEVLGWDVVLHLLELDRAWRGEEAMAVVRLGDRGDAPGGDTAHAARQWRRHPAQRPKEPGQAVLQQQLVERAGEIALGRGRVGLVEELRL